MVGIIAAYRGRWRRDARAASSIFEKEGAGPATEHVDSRPRHLFVDEAAHQCVVGRKNAADIAVGAFGQIQAQVDGAGRLHRQAADVRGLVHRFLGHAAVRRPLPAGDGYETALRNGDGVLARERGGVAAFATSHQRAQAGKHGGDVFAARRRGQVAPRVLEEVIDLPVGGHGVVGNRVRLRVGRADEDAIVPGDGEEDAGVVCVGDE
jgi:hypothetical protein